VDLHAWPVEPMSDPVVVVKVKCRKSHWCVVLPWQITPPGFPMCDVCYGPMFPQEARNQKPSDPVYRNGQPS